MSSRAFIRNALIFLEKDSKSELVTGRAFGPSGYLDFPTGIVGRENGRDDRDFGNTVQNPKIEENMHIYCPRTAICPNNPRKMHQKCYTIGFNGLF